MGASCPVGLDYNVVFKLMEILGVKQEERQEMMRSIQIMESAALKQMSQDRKAS